MNFLTDDFLLQNQYAKTLYHEAAEQMPIFDYHNHLDAKEILEDGCFRNLTEAWLAHDHYKWRAMRAYGVPEELITGNGDPYEKYLAYVRTIRASIGNPLYHWTHLELARYFGITEALTEDNAKTIWDQCNALLATGEYSVRNLLKMQKVTHLCTTDSPADTLEAHLALQKENTGIAILPSYRPDVLLYPERNGFREYVKEMEKVCQKPVRSLSDLAGCLEDRLVYFVKAGCVVSDHSIEGAFFNPAATEADADAVFRKCLKGEAITAVEAVSYRGVLFTLLGSMYRKHRVVMQLHIGAIRNNSRKLVSRAGANTGCDSIGEGEYIAQLGGLLNALERTDSLPRTIVYCLNPSMNEALATMCGNFLMDGGRSQVQWGPAWWFNDHKDGIEEQLRIYARQGVLMNHPGMLTDSRSFLSYPRHEYFRRILCNLVGTWVERGEYPEDMEYLKTMIRHICYDNAMEYFGGVR